MLEFFHQNVWAAVGLGAAAFILVVVWAQVDQRRELEQRTGTWRTPKEPPPPAPKPRDE